MTAISAQYSVVIIGADGLGARAEVVRSALLREIREIVALALASIRLRPEDVIATERGDLFQLEVPPTVSPGRLASTFVDALNAELAARAAGRGPADAIRLTVALHRAAEGAAGQQPAGAVHLAEALVNASALPAVHKAAPRGYVVLVVSAQIYELFSQSGYRRVDTAAFLPLRLDSEGSGQVTGWVTVPGYSAPPGMDDKGTRAAKPDREETAPGRSAGVLVQGNGRVENLVNVQGDQVIHGDLVFGHRVDETGSARR
ncbi:MAG TPA: hypothetical protein VGM14_15410 [Streptosporangiaceae bacterium]